MSTPMTVKLPPDLGQFVLVLQGALPSIKRCMKLALNPTGRASSTARSNRYIGSSKWLTMTGSIAMHPRLPTALANSRKIL